MGNLEESRSATNRRSKKRKRDNLGDELPVGDERNTESSNRDKNTTKKRKGHSPTPATADEEATASAMGKELNVFMAETSKLHKLIMNKDHKEKGVPEKDGQRPKRFIVFIGNLPFTATTASISKHFASLKPASIRHITHKDQPTKSKGYAFLEFEGYDRMKTCLKLHHQSTFNDGLSAARKINVELTAGGGGAKSKERRTKLKTKNLKLNEERKRQSKEEEKTKQDKRNVAGDACGVHPSRRGRIPAR